MLWSAPSPQANRCLRECVVAARSVVRQLTFPADQGGDSERDGGAERRAARVQPHVDDLVAATGQELDALVEERGKKTLFCGAQKTLLRFSKQKEELETK